MITPAQNNTIQPTGTLIFFCGKMAAGKSTLAQKMAHERCAVLLSEDAWLASLYPDQIQSLEDYITYSKRLKPPMKQLVQSILTSGTDVVMDFPANTPGQRAWFKGLFSEIKAPHHLIFIDVPDEICLKQLDKRRQQEPERANTDTPEMFAQVTRYFEAPAEAEGFEIQTITCKRKQTQDSTF